MERLDPAATTPDDTSPDDELPVATTTRVGRWRLREFHSSCTVHVDADPATVFGTITDIDRLPEWNEGIELVRRRPPELTAGASWKVRINVKGMPPWDSVATLLEHDPARGRFAYRSQSDDGNPTYVDWSWMIVPSSGRTDDDRPGGCDVIVTWDGYPKTKMRQLIFAKIRSRQLPREVQASLRQLSSSSSRANG